MISLVETVLNGDRLALARLLTQVENDTSDGRDALDALFPYTGKAHLIGVTGAPGTGKSSLVNQLALHFRKQSKRVAIVAVDPSSPFTGGAVLGDRVRMKDLSGDHGVFIRSMASRGSIGGLAQATASIAQVFDAAGYEIIMIETVGAGQSEVDIAKLAHTTLVVEAPGLGDDIQAIKAGILEIADIIVVNKADRPGAESTEKALKSMLDLAHPTQRVFAHHGAPLRLPPFSAPFGGASRKMGGEKRGVNQKTICGFRSFNERLPPMEKELKTWLIRLRSMASICASAEIGLFGNAPALRLNWKRLFNPH